MAAVRKELDQEYEARNVSQSPRRSTPPQIIQHVSDLTDTLWSTMAKKLHQLHRWLSSMVLLSWNGSIGRQDDQEYHQTMGAGAELAYRLFRLRRPLPGGLRGAIN